MTAFYSLPVRMAERPASPSSQKQAGEVRRRGSAQRCVDAIRNYLMARRAIGAKRRPDLGGRTICELGRLQRRPRFPTNQNQGR